MTVASSRVKQLAVHCRTLNDESTSRNSVEIPATITERRRSRHLSTNHRIVTRNSFTLSSVQVRSFWLIYNNTVGIWAKLYKLSMR